MNAYDYYYTKTPEIEALLTRIEIAKALLENLPTMPSVEENLRRVTMLKSSLFSARIEGNTLTLDQMGSSHGSTKEKTEVHNLLSAIRFARQHWGNITKDILKKIHLLVMQDFSTDAGMFRTEPSAIFNTAGQAVYISPLPQHIPKLFYTLLRFINEKPQIPLPVAAAISHVAFEKIHPFLDGNGRVGRILATMHLARLGYSFRFLVSFEEYFDAYKTDYYDGLSANKKDVTLFVTFFLQAIAASAESSVEKIKHTKEESIEDSLLPRRAEILAIIHDHKVLSFDQIRRRFLAVQPRTLHYDMQFLLKKKLIKKLGATRGALYSEI